MSSNRLPAESKLEQARRHYIQALAETMNMYGLSPSMGLLYGIMFFRDTPMTLDEMCAQSGMSKTSMSTGVRELARLRLVHKKWEKGVRKDLYQAEQDLFRAFREFFTHLWSQEIELCTKGLAATEQEIRALLESGDLAPEDVKQAEADLAKLRHAQDYYDWLNDLTKAMDSGQLMKYFVSSPVPKE